MEKLSSLNILVFLTNESMFSDVNKCVLEAGAQVFVARNKEEAISIIDSCIIDLLVLDDFSHFEVPQGFVFGWTELRRVVLTKTKVIPLKNDTRCTYLSKDFTHEILTNTISTLFWQMQDLMVFDEYLSPSQKLKMSLIMGLDQRDLLEFEPTPEGLIGAFQDPLGSSLIMGVLVVDFYPNQSYRLVVDVKRLLGSRVEVRVDNGSRAKWNEIIKMIKQFQETIDKYLLTASGK